MKPNPISVNHPYAATSDILILFVALFIQIVAPYRPAATEAQFLFMKYVFDELGYRRYEWKCNNHNEPSKRAAIRFGFQPEGVFRQHLIVKGENRDTTWFSIIDKEWPVLRTAYERWLDPSNFDTDGMQRRRLEKYRA